jgi:hypothetical protein
MPAEVVDDPFGLACVFSGGATALVRMSGAPPSPLVRDLLHGLAGLVHPHGSVDSVNSVKQYMSAAARFVAVLDENHLAGGAGGLTRAILAGFLLATDREREVRVRRMLTALDEQRRVLSVEVRDMLAGRPFNRKDTRSTPLAPYSETEWARLRQACEEAVAQRLATHRQTLRSAETGADPFRHGFTEANLAWLLLRTGPASATTLGAPHGMSGWVVLNRFGSPEAVNHALFPHGEDAVPYRLLFGIRTGIVPDGIDGLGVADLDWAGEATVLLDYVKGRTAKESLTLSRAAVRLLEQWLDHSAQARRFAPAAHRNALWLRYLPSRHGPWASGPLTYFTVGQWIRRVGVLGDDGRPLPINRHRIRTTFESLRERRAWFGSTRATIDPNHTPRVEGDHYLTATTPAQRDAVDAIIEAAQQDLLRKAHPPLVVTTDDHAALAAQLPRLVGGLCLDDTAIRELIGGVRDVFVAACADPLSGLHGPAGKPCPARPWVCLLCPLAIFTVRHAANLLRLKAFFARQGRAMPIDGFLAVFGPYAQRVEEILHRFDPATLAALATQVADTDDELPLLPEERTT